MAETVGLTILPLELLEVIVSYLSAADLARCMAVNKTWHNIFGYDIFWEKHCTANLSNYLSKTKCLVEPAFKLPKDTTLYVAGKRLEFLQEQHLWQNWDAGRFQKEEIEFDSKDVDKKVSFYDNDHLCFHDTLKTVVWNVAESPAFSVLTIEYFVPGWEDIWNNVYKIIENYLVVIRFNLVQIFEISLDTKTWSLCKVFFYNEPEEFSEITPGNFDYMFQVEGEGRCWLIKLYACERIICGHYLVGLNLGEEFPLLHIWDLKTGTKVKEDKCDICVGSYDIRLMPAKEVTNKVLVTYRFENSAGPPKYTRSSIIYDLSQMQFIMSTRREHVGDVVYFDGRLSVVRENSLHILYHCNPLTHNETNVELTCISDFLSWSIQPLGSNLLIPTTKHIISIDPSKAVIPNKVVFMEVDFKLDIINILCNRYILLHEDWSKIKEIWKTGKSLKKVLGFPPYLFGRYIASNNACSKIVLDKGWKLIVFNFW